MTMKIIKKKLRIIKTCLLRKFLRIYLGKRIRDLIYLEDKKLILLALEEKGELGILRNTAQ